MSGGCDMIIRNVKNVEAVSDYCVIRIAEGSKL